MTRRTGPYTTTPGLGPVVMIIPWNIIELTLDFHGDGEARDRYKTALKELAALL
ncbi:MAG: hypothetical protein WA709_22155 [Stellaceae bacterium]